MPEEPHEKSSRNTQDRPRAFLATKSSAARKSTFIGGQDNAETRPSTSTTPAPISHPAQHHLGPDPQTYAPPLEQPTAAARKYIPRMAQKSAVARKSIPIMTWKRIQVTAQTRRGISAMLPPPLPVAAARKYIVQDGSRPVARPSLCMKRSTPQDTLWAPSMRPPSKLPHSDMRPHQQPAQPSFGGDRVPNYTKQETVSPSSRQTLPLPSSARRRFSIAPPRKIAPLMGSSPYASYPQRYPVSHMTPSDMKARKTMQALEPAWLTADSSYKATLGRKVTRDDVGWMPVTSMSTSRRISTNRAEGTNVDGLRMVDEVKAQIKPGLKFRLEGESESEDEIEIDEVPGAMPYPGKAARKYNQIARKSMRKTIAAPVLSDSSLEVTSSDEKSDFHLSESPEIDELEDSDIDSNTANEVAPPPEELMTALEALTLASVHMQKARRLPFLLRDLRRGFERRCQLVGVPTSEESLPISASVVYKLRISDGGVEFGGLGPTKAKEYMHKAWMKAWHCPLCELHGEFKTRQMLGKHLTWDHDEVNTTWEQLRGGEWQIALIIPEFVEEDEVPGNCSPDSDLECTSLPVPSTPGRSTPDRPLSIHPSTTTTISSTSPPGVSTAAVYPIATESLALDPRSLEVSSSNRPDLPTPVPTAPFDPARTSGPILQHASNEQPFAPTRSTTSSPAPVGYIPSVSPVKQVTIPTMQSPIPVTKLFTPPPFIRVQAPIPSPSTSPVPMKLKYRSPSPPSRLSSQSASSRARSTTATSAATTTTINITTTTTTTFQRSRKLNYVTASSTPSRYPTPPPPSDPLGPAAQYPYLPFTFDNEDSKVHYSARPGGPRLYDLLNCLNMEHFVLSWAVVDQEEEMFESDDVRDEDKVMQALWGRWIMANRNKFVANYYAGTMAFVNEYWRVIHRAAGWAALRAWLLMLVLNRFVTGSEIVKIIKHYEDLTGMASWYSDQKS